MFKTIPNTISSLRIIGLPILLYLIYTQALSIFLIAFAIYQFSDLLDGYLARRLRQESTLGHLLDSLGDLCSYVIAFWSLYTYKPAILHSSAGLIIGIYCIAILLRLFLCKMYCYSFFPKIPGYHLAKWKFYIQSIGLLLVFNFAALGILLYLSLAVGILHEIKIMHHALKNTSPTQKLALQ